jgi:DNA-binding response OmpR family regulator
MGLEIIQIIDDDIFQARLLDSLLRKASYRTNVAHDGATGLEDIKRLQPSLVLVDCMMPGMDGLEVVRRLREDPDTKALPVIMITGLGAVEHKAAGLENGADDYITKPIHAEEVLARVRAILRRTQSWARMEKTQVNEGLRVLEEHYTVDCFGNKLTLPKHEFKVLKRLVRQYGRTVSSEELGEMLWGQDAAIHLHKIESIVQSLRVQLEGDPAAPKLLISVPGGFRLVPPSQEIVDRMAGAVPRKRERAS